MYLSLLKNQAVWHKSCHIKFNKDKVDRAKRQRERDESAESSGAELKQNWRQLMDKMACLFCQQEDGNLHEFRTLEAGKSIRQMATELQDTELMARMEGGDVVALEAKYHLECLTAI